METNENNIVNEENEKEPIKVFIYSKEEDLYQIEFLKKEEGIQIKCNNTSDVTDKIYSYELTLEEIKKTNKFKNPLQILKFFKKLDNNNSMINKEENYLLLKIYFESKNNPNNGLLLKLEEYKEEDQINTLKDVIKVIKDFKKENEYLKKENENFNKANETLKNRINSFEQKMELNFFYNSFDVNAFQLENIFQNLKYKDIIKYREDFALINQGIKKLFNKNIIYFEPRYKYKENEEFDLINFKNIIDKVFCSVFVIITKDNKRFGAFFMNKNLVNTNQIINNQKYLNMIQIIQNIMYDNQNNSNQFGQNNSGYGYGTNVSQSMNFNTGIFIFSFSFDESKIFYLNEKNCSSFSISYDKNRQSLFGNEISAGYFILSGKSEFNVKDLELYEIEIGKFE